MSLTTLWTIVVSIIIFGLLIFVHELGHFWAARWAKIRVLEFALGMGKEIFGWEKGGTRFTLRIFPLGGFCRMHGEDPDDPGLDPEGSFQRSPWLKRIVVLAAGSVMNFALGIVLFFLIFFLLMGIPDASTSKIGSVMPESRAYYAGLQDNDIILAVDGVEVADWESLVTVIHTSPEEELVLRVQRDEQIFSTTVVPELVEGRGLIGITYAYSYKKYNFFAAMSLSVDNFLYWVKILYVGFYQMIMRIIPADIAGPVGIVGIIGQFMERGLIDLIFFTAIISINLGVINLLPIPAIDGSKILFLLVEKVRGKPIDPQKEGYIHFVGFVCLIMLILVVTYFDIMRLVTKS